MQLSFGFGIVSDFHYGQKCIDCRKQKKETNKITHHIHPQLIN